MLAACSALWAQFAPVAQARTPEEYDAFLGVVEAAGAPAAAERFLRDWPDSELRGRVYEMGFEACRRQGRRTEALAWGEKALAANPHHLPLRAALAALRANGAGSPEELARAEADARRALADLEAYRPPKSVARAEWRRIDGRCRADALTALGLVAFKRGDTPGAIQAFETAARLAPAPDAALLYRLGKLYQLAGRKQDAAKLFAQAAALEEPAIRGLALAELEAAR
jgi:tetratricopeptide (TPR) repeat protein